MILLLLLTLPDGFLADIVDRIPSSKYTILYITSPREFPNTDSVIYTTSEGSYQDSLHMEMKRDYSASGSSLRPSNKSTSLFEEYQYFTPGWSRLPLSSLFAPLTSCQASLWVSLLHSCFYPFCILVSML